MKGYRETDVVSYAWNVGTIGLELNFWQKKPQHHRRCLTGF